MPKPDLIIFDCDGVLVDSEVLSCRCLSEGLAGYGIKLDPAQAKLAFQVISERYDVRRSTAITTNRAFKDWPKVFPDTLNAQVIAERLTERAETFVLDGKGYRSARH